MKRALLCSLQNLGGGHVAPPVPTSMEGKLLQKGLLAPCEIIAKKPTALARIREQHMLYGTTDELAKNSVLVLTSLRQRKN